MADDRLALLEEHDDFAHVRNKIRMLADLKDEYAGVPIPIDGENLIIEPSYRFADVLGRQPTVDASAEKYKLRNHFWSKRYRCDVYICEEADGSIRHYLSPAFHHLDQDLRTLGCSVAWGVEQESNALNLLAGLLRHRTFKQYLLTGMFLESSPRSGLTYMFRRLKPTVVIDTKGETCRVVCCLCQHPIGYYEGSWAGAMCPTDDVIAHLMLMRGDEPMYWRRSNQIPAHRPEAGL